jgi:hypothetical protein
MADLPDDLRSDLSRIEARITVEHDLRETMSREDAYAVLGEAAVVVSTDYDQEPDGLEAHLADAIANLMHLAGEENIDFQHAVRRARSYYLSESESNTVPA